MDAVGIDRVRAAWKRINAVLGVLDPEEKDLNAHAKALIRRRDQARKRGDFQQADHLRESLLNYGILVFDSPVGSIWERIQEQTDHHEYQCKRHTVADAPSKRIGS